MSSQLDLLLAKLKQTLEYSKKAVLILEYNFNTSHGILFYVNIPECPPELSNNSDVSLTAKQAISGFHERSGR